MNVAAHQPLGSSTAITGQEETDIHTRILRFALGIEESRGYWEHFDPTVPESDRALQAFEQRWFGAKSLHCVRYVLSNMRARYDAFPSALSVLRRWRAMTLATRQTICHFHLQLSDPMYRKFTGTFLVARHGTRDAQVDRSVVLRWVKTEHASRWSEATCTQFASKLLAAAGEAGLISPRKDPRSILLPKVPDEALAYLLYVLRETRFEGSLTDNPYFASLGLEGGLLDQRLRHLPGLTFHRMGNLTEFDWAARDVVSWAEATL